MAASMSLGMAVSARRCFRSIVTLSRRDVGICYGQNNTSFCRSFNSGQNVKYAAGVVSGRRLTKVTAGAVGLAVAGVAGYSSLVTGESTGRVLADSGRTPAQLRPKHPISRTIINPTDNTGLKLTLYQYQTCPFCCKLRAYLDYRGFSYDVIEVNSVRRTQIKWSNYRKVPILVVEGQGQEGFMQLNDSSVITSILESFLIDRSLTIEQLLTYYPSLESKGSRGKTIYEFPNRYHLMYGENNPDRMQADMKEERKWRDWTDSVLVHMLSPNVYRTPSEALQAFNYFSEVGDWENNFSFMERKLVIYVGATVMYFLGKMLRRKYNLKDDVRESLYDACKEWTKAVGTKRHFMGGNEPNLADLAVYGVLNSIEGCNAFEDLLQRTNIGEWYYRTRDVVRRREGISAM